MTRPIISSGNAIASKAIDAIVALRPEALAHFNAGGRWMDLPTAWRAQAMVNLARLADEVKGARLRFATGDALRALCASEFSTVLPPDPQAAVGQVVHQRPLPTTGHAPAGVVKKGTRFVKAANPSAVPLPIGAAAYVATRSIYVPQDFVEQVTVPVEATSAGVDGNVPSFTNYATPTSIQPGDQLFDPTLTVQGCSAAGGSSGLSDPELVAAARAYAVGQYGPTMGALVAGMLSMQSVRHYAVFPAGTLHYAQVYPTDETWSASTPYRNAVQQELTSNWTGFGCRARTGLVLNTHIAVAATIVLKTSDDLADTDDIDDAVRATAESYFNDRPDWYRWRVAHLQALLSRADPRILHCTSVVVSDAITGSTLAEPANTFGQVWNEGTIVHWLLTDRTVTATYQPPT